DRLLCLRYDWPLPGDRRQLADGGVERLGVGDRLADAHVDDDLLELGNLVDVLVAEALLQFGTNLAVVLFSKPFRHDYAFTESRAGSPQRTQMRWTVPSEVRPRRKRVGSLHFSQTYCSDETGSGDSFSMIPPVCMAPPMFEDLVPCFV